MEVVEDLGFAENAASCEPAKARNFGLQTCFKQVAAQGGSQASGEGRRTGMPVGSTTKQTTFPSQGKVKLSTSADPCDKNAAIHCVEPTGIPKVRLRPFEPARREVSLRSTSHTTQTRNEGKGGRSRDYRI